MTHFQRLLLGSSLGLWTWTAGGAPGPVVEPPDALAIRGYDAVAYFTQGQAKKGRVDMTFHWRNRTWRFATPENRTLFAADPRRYAPQYDGYCAWAMSEARRAETDPEVWKIVDGKLYLNCSPSAAEKWSADIPGNIRKADENWLRLFSGQ